MDYEAKAREVAERVAAKITWNEVRQGEMVAYFSPAIATAIREAVEGKEDRGKRQAIGIMKTLWGRLEDELDEVPRPEGLPHVIEGVQLSINEVRRTLSGEKGN